ANKAGILAISKDHIQANRAGILAISKDHIQASLACKFDTFKYTIVIMHAHQPRPFVEVLKHGNKTIMKRSKRDMTYEEKQKLSLNLQNLPLDHLDGIISRVRLLLHSIKEKTEGIMPVGQVVQAVQVATPLQAVIGYFLLTLQAVIDSDSDGSSEEGSIKG
ncbi:transcription factor GTE4-like protein, partial [Tanacetum coccineum]